MPDSSKEGMDIKFTILSVIVLVLTTYVLILVFNKILTKGENCKYEEPLYNNLQNIDGNNDDKLKNFYIKTAYNCCSVSDKWVNICALKYTIREGCRCLDFEIFDVNGKPVIGTTLAQNGTEKDSYNHLPLSDVLETINEYAFNRIEIRNWTDPLLLNFRIKSTSVNVYDKMADSIYDILNTRLLDTTYSYYNRDISLNANIERENDASVFDTNLSEFINKIIIMSSDCNLTTMNKSTLRELVNVVGGKSGISGGATCNINADTTQLTSKNYPLVQLNNGHAVGGTNQVNNLDSVIDDYVAIMIPDDNKNNNINYCYHKKMGIQMIGMLYQKSAPKDYSKQDWLYLNSVSDEEREELLYYEELGNIDNYNKWFYDNGFAFILKGDDKHGQGITGMRSCELSDVWNKDNQEQLYFDEEEEEEETSRYKRYKNWLYKYLNKLGF